MGCNPLRSRYRWNSVRGWQHYSCYTVAMGVSRSEETFDRLRCRSLSKVYNWVRIALSRWGASETSNETSPHNASMQYTGPVACHLGLKRVAVVFHQVIKVDFKTSSRSHSSRLGKKNLVPRSEHLDHVWITMLCPEWPLPFTILNVPIETEGTTICVWTWSSYLTLPRTPFGDTRRVPIRERDAQIYCWLQGFLC